MANTRELDQVVRLRKDGTEIPGIATFDMCSEDPCDVCVHTRSIPRNLAQPAAVDGKTVMGPWARMCLGCFRDAGVGLGVGKGQALLAPTN